MCNIRKNEAEGFIYWLFNVLLFIFLAVLFAGCGPSPSGVFLLEGGREYIVLEQTVVGNVRLKDTSLYNVMGTIKPQMDGKRLRLVFLSDEPPASFTLLNLRVGEWNTFYEMTPSKTEKGDWDLVRWDRQLFGENSVKDISRLPLPPMDTPFPSFLHKLDDERVVEYFHAVKKGEPGRDLANALIQDHPRDLYIRNLYMDSLVRAGSADELERKIVAWKDDYRKAKDPFLPFLFHRAKKSLDYLKLTQKGKNGYQVLGEIIREDLDLEARIREVLKIGQYDQAIPPYSILKYTETPSFLDYKTMAALFKTQALFMMLQGKRQSACDLLASTYDAGRLMGLCRDPISVYVGNSMRAISLGGLEVYSLNCAPSRDELEKTADLLDERNLLLIEDYDDCAVTTESLHPMTKDNMSDDNIIRSKIIDARLQLLRTAVAANLHLLETGRFPSSPGDLFFKEKSNIPSDPFQKKGLKFFPGKTDFTCYSIGPDETDNNAALSYDPTNGAKSLGDIILHVPQERKYPFPRDGLKASSKEEVKEIFPHGLPPDSFATTRGKSLGISEAQPLKIYSYGPDTDEWEDREEGAPPRPEIAYDPTNGIISQGDLFITIPVK